MPIRNVFNLVTSFSDLMGSWSKGDATSLPFDQTPMLNSIRICSIRNHANQIRGMQGCQAERLFHFRIAYFMGRYAVALVIKMGKEI